MTQYNIAIAGAGIGGLSAALALSHLGHTVTIFEQFKEPRPIGSGLILQPTGLNVLTNLGLDNEVLSKGCRIDQLVGHVEPSGKKILDVCYQALNETAFGLAVQRSTLFDILFTATQSRCVTFETDFQISTTCSCSRDRIRLQTIDGRITEPFDLVVDALGHNSPLTKIKGRALPYGALWANLDWDDTYPFRKHELVQRYFRSRKMVGIMPCGQTSPRSKERVAFFWSLKVEQYESWLTQPLSVWKNEVAQLWPETSVFLEQINSHEDLTMARYTHRTNPWPVSGRIAHIGDSFHSASPQLGQGANMALLDAFALAKALETQNGLDNALQEYARSRRLHILIYQTASYLFTPVYQSDSYILPFLRDHLMAQVIRIHPTPKILAALVAGVFGDPMHELGLFRKYLPK